MTTQRSDDISPILNSITVACPTCGADSGRSCRTPDGRKRWIHVARAKAAYRAADLYNPHYNPTGSRVPAIYRERSS